MLVFPREAWQEIGRLEEEFSSSGSGSNEDRLQNVAVGFGGSSCIGDSRVEARRAAAMVPAGSAAVIRGRLAAAVTRVTSA